MDRDEISSYVANDAIFQAQYETISQLLQNQDSKLDDEQYIATLHALFYEIVRNTALKLLHSSSNDKLYEQTADTALLIISIYNEYSAICYSSLMYKFLQLVLKEKILLI